MKKTVIALLSLCFTSYSFAAGGYGDAGCGLGSIVFQNQQKGLVQIFAATTNGTFGTQTFGISSGTSNCGGGGTSPSVSQYIEANKSALATEMSKGSGESLNGLAQMMGCKNVAAFETTLQKNYKTIFPSQNAEAAQIEASIRNVINHNSALKKNCQHS